MLSSIAALATKSSGAISGSKDSDDAAEKARLQALIDQEQEELQLALAISQSEAEAKVIKAN